MWVLHKKEAHIKAKYLPIKFALPKIDDYVRDKPMGYILHKFFNCRSQNATTNIYNGEKCDVGKGRSYYDAYRLLLYYRPNTTFIEMYRFLQERCEKEYNLQFKRQKKEYQEQINDRYWWDTPYIGRAFWYCPHIGRGRYSEDFNTNFK
jgi:hypothetical protein